MNNKDEQYNLSHEVTLKYLSLCSDKSEKIFYLTSLFVNGMFHANLDDQAVNHIADTWPDLIRSKHEEYKQFRKRIGMDDLPISQLLFSNKDDTALFIYDDEKGLLSFKSFGNKGFNSIDIPKQLIPFLISRLQMLEVKEQNKE